jgi:peptidoglycan hydrolase-like protein with peptidoglycan-binding domain
MGPMMAALQQHRMSAPRYHPAPRGCGCGNCAGRGVSARPCAGLDSWAVGSGGFPARADKNTPVGAAAAAPAINTGIQPGDTVFLSPTLAGNAELQDVLNKRKALRDGSKGEAVRKLQTALLAEGYALSSGADGDFGAETTEAVRAFEKRWRMVDDGIVGDQVLGLLDSHLFAKGLLTIGEGSALGALLKRPTAAALDTGEADRRVTNCPAASKAERRTACIQPVIIAKDDGTAPTTLPSFTLAQNIWEKCCINLSVLGAQTVKKTDFQTLDESPTDVPTAEESALFAAAGTSSCIQVFVAVDFAQGATIGKGVSGGGATYSGGTANPKVVLVEGAVPAVAAHEIGHALGASHDAHATVMKPTGAYNVANASAVSSTVCAQAKTGAVSAGTSGSADCCMKLS